MKLTRYFDTHQEAFAFESGLQEANTGHLHAIERGTSVDYPGMVFVTWHDENRKPLELPERHPPLTPAEYAQRNAAICPVCRGRDITGDSVDIDGRQAFQKVTCNNPDCEASWVDCYELSGYDNLEC